MISDDYRKGFEAAKRGALMCAESWRSWDLRNHGKTAQAIIEHISRMTPELHIEWQRKQEEEK
jgi:hypothetical protein